MNRSLSALVCAASAACGLVFGGAAYADGHESGPRAAAEAIEAFPSEPAVTFHRVEIQGETVYYRATAGVTTLGNRGDEPSANMFSIAYERIDINFDALMSYGGVATGVDAWPQPRTRLFAQMLNEMSVRETGSPVDGDLDPWVAFLGLAAIHAEGWADETTPGLDLFVTKHGGPDRPVTFSFNGGPGSSSVWLHLGIFGPKRVDYADAIGNPGPPPYRPVDNEASLLDHSDFVFIDPVSTGYSRAVNGTPASNFHSVGGDIRSVAEFIRRWIGDNDRWGSPLFVAGESYGTTRAAGLVEELFTAHGIATSGVILVSAVMDFSTLRYQDANDLPPLLFLPTFAATAHYHGALDDEHQAKDVMDFVREVEAFALEEYAPALLQGDRLPADRRRAIAEKLASYTGLTPEYVESTNLRIVISRFTKELLRDRRTTVGRLDSRYVGADRDAAGASYEYDPSYSAILANYSATLMILLREELGYESDMPYKILTGDVRPWDYSRVASNRFLNISERLRSAMNQVPGMRVFVASGIYDLATPHFATDHTIAHMALPPNLRGQVEVEYYEAGHMMYVHDESRAKLKEDLDSFYSRTLADHLSKESK